MVIRETPRLSVGLPVYNGEDYLAESLEALLGQTYEDFELIISDNASTDGTADICRRYAKQDSRIRYIRQPRNLGCNPNHNFVIQQARGELFKLASDDDLYARDLLKRCVDALDESPHLVLAHSWSATIDTSSTVINLVNYPVDTDAPRAPDRFRSMLFDGWGDDDGGVIRTSVLRRVTARSARSRIICGSGASIPGRQGSSAMYVTGARSWTRAGQTACGTRPSACTANTSGVT
jgi:glycosyltransferase involved in cell wall biosynthesis